MNAGAFSIIMSIIRLGFQIHAYMKKKRAELTPEQRAEYDAEMEKTKKESFEHAGNMGTGVGE